MQNDLNPDKYVSGLDEGEEPITPEALEADIRRHKALEQDVYDAIPNTVTVGMFSINCADIRNAYANKYDSIVKKEVQLIAAKAKQQTFDIINEFNGIHDRITKEPATIEELTDTKKYINECGAEVEKLRKQIEKCMAVYGICDNFQHEFSGVEQGEKWAMVGKPQHIAKIIEAKNGELEKLKEVMTKKMEQDQEEFNELVEGLENTVGSFHTLCRDPTKFTEHADTAKNVMDKIQTMLEEGRNYNAREYAVGKEATDYSAIAQMSRDFQPFYNLWMTMAQWHKNQEAWMEGDWHTLNAGEMESEFENNMKVVNQVFRYFREREQYKEIFEVAADLKKQIDEFKPYVPLAVALRKDGMAERHWAEITKNVGFEVEP